MLLLEAQERAALMYATLERHAARIIVAGSVRREKRFCNDVEIVLEPHMAEDLLGTGTPIIEPIHRALREMGEVVKCGDRWVSLGDVFGIVGLGLDVFIVHPPAMWGSIVAIRTGPGELGQYCVTKMRERGFRHVDGHAESLETGALVPTETECSFFELAGVECVAPTARENLARRLGAMQWRG